MSERLQNEPTTEQLSDMDALRIEKLEKQLINRDTISAMREHLKEMDRRGWLQGKNDKESEEAEIEAVSSVFESLADLPEYDGLLPDAESPEPSYDKAAASVFKKAEGLMYMTDEDVDAFFDEHDKRTIEEEGVDGEPSSEDDLDDIELDDDLEDEDDKEKNETPDLSELDRQLGDAQQKAIDAKKTGNNVAYATEVRRLVQLAEIYSQEMERLHGWDKSESDELLAHLLNEIDKQASEQTEDEAINTDRSKVGEMSAELLELEGRLREARDHLASLNVKMSGRVIRSGLLKDELAAAQAEWQRLQKEAGIMAIKYLRDVEGMPLDTINELTTIAAMGAANEAKLLAEKEAELAANGNGGKKLQRMWRGYAKRYNEAKWYKKALYLAPVGLVAGVAVGTIFGALGGGLFGAAVAKGAVRGSILAKIRSQIAHGDNFTDEAALNRAILDGDNAGSLDEAVAARVAGINAEFTRDRVEKSVRQNQKKMLGSVAMGATVGAVSGAIAGIVTNQLTDQHPIRGGGVSRHNVFGGRPSAPVEDAPVSPAAPAETIIVPPAKLGPIEFAGSRGIDLGARDAWPFKIANQLGLSEQDSIELARQNGFTFRQGMYWKGGRIMNPEEMKWHNLALADIAAKRFQG